MSLILIKKTNRIMSCLCMYVLIEICQSCHVNKKLDQYHNILNRMEYLLLILALVAFNETYGIKESYNMPF
jgi:hypothetical protein